MMVTVRTRTPGNPRRPALERRVTFCSVLFLVVLLAACSREQEDWRTAERTDTIGSYGQFIEHHPDSELTTQAHTRIAQLGEDRDWQEASSRGNEDAYRQFLEKHPAGKWSQEARIRMENFALGETRSAERAVVAPRATAMTASGAPPPATAASAAPPLASPALPAVVPPSAAAASSAAPAVVATPGGAIPTAVAASAGYGIQLGAFSSEEKASAQWQAMTGRFSSQLRGLNSHVVAAETPQGRIYRLQADVGDESRARAICDALREQSQPCVPVIPR